MEKNRLFFIGMIFLIGIVSTYLIINYNLEYNKEYVQSYCSSWAEKKNLAVVQCVGTWNLEENDNGIGECSWQCDEPVGPGPFSCNEPYEVWDDSLQECVDSEYNENLIGGCAGVSLDNQQECCDNWARDNGIVRIMCVGSWVFEDGRCSWVCDEF